LKELKEMSKTMAEIDFAMLTTRTDGGQLATRQMSNNGEVEMTATRSTSVGTARAPSTISVAPQVAL
jgi:general stress protein 26